MCAPQPYSQGMMIYTKYSDPLICTGCWLQDHPHTDSKIQECTSPLYNIVQYAHRPGHFASALQYSSY
jgi:hypothetical protein